MWIVYAYASCDQCRKALKWLKAEGVPHEVKAIRETPPSPDEIRAAIAAHGGELRPLFNTSGNDYRAMNLKEKLPALSVDEAVELLSTNGNLVKRPFVVGEGVSLAGFREEAWRAALG